MSSSNLAAGIRQLRGRLAGQQRHEETDEQLLLAFTTRRDDNAFAALVRRHGPMVLGLCRRVLGAETWELPYLSAVKKVDNALGLEPITVDFALQRGVWVKGRVTDKTTGKPLRARIEYFSFADNPRAKEIARLVNFHGRFSFEDGCFQIPVLPGHGLLAVRAQHDHSKRQPSERSRDHRRRKSEGSGSQIRRSERPGGRDRATDGVSSWRTTPCRLATLRRSVESLQRFCAVHCQPAR